MKRINIRKYLILTEQSLQSAMAYRVTFFISLFAGLIQALVLYYIWQVVYDKQRDISGFTRSQIVTYVFISHAVRGLYGFYTETSISAKIRDGSIAMELIKPLNYQLARFFESLGSVAVEGILMGILIVTLGFGLFQIESPLGVVAGTAFGVSLVLSVLINFTISYIVGLFSFWTTSVYGLINSKRFVVDFLSGTLVPLAFFPSWLQKVAFVLPFNAIVHLPVSIYLGRIAGVEVCYALLKQVVFLVVLWTIGSLIWSQASKQITIHGG